MFSGSIPALVTPFAADGRFDEAAYRALIDWQIAEGSSALVPCGTTGESATMTAEEHFGVVRVCVDQAAGRVPVIAGAGSNDTRVAIQNIAAAKAAGADAALMVPPYYNRPSQEGIFQHFKAVAESSASSPRLRAGPHWLCSTPPSRHWMHARASFSMSFSPKHRSIRAAGG